MLEEHRFSADGRLETIGAGKYRIPSVSSLPLQMNVTLLKDSGNPKAVYSSKVVRHFISSHLCLGIDCREASWDMLPFGALVIWK